MRIRIQHRTRYAYSAPARLVQQVLRLTPRSHEGQHVVSWRIDCNVDCRLHRGEDAYGNITHTFTARGPLESVELVVDGDLETFDTIGVIRNSVERFPPVFYLRDTDLTHAGPNLRAFAFEAVGSTVDRLERMHLLMDAIFERMTFDKAPTQAQTKAEEAITLGRGVCQDFAHIFIACARVLEVPARYASGHFLRNDGVIEQEAGHAWAEAYVEDLGWIGFDPAHASCSGESHIRVAVGPDYLAAAPVRGLVNGGSGEILDVNVHVSQVSGQRQS